MKFIYYSTMSLLAVPILVNAQDFYTDNRLKTFVANILGFINDVLVPFAFALALLFFIYAMYRFFIQGGGSDDDVKNGRTYLLWSIIALVVIVSVWGITNLIASGFGLNKPDAINQLIPSAKTETGGSGARPSTSLGSGEIQNI